MSVLRLPFEGNFRESQAFGSNPELYKQFLVKQPDGSTGPLKGHNGLDFALPSNTPVVAPHDGKVIEAAFDADGYGNYIKVENAEEGSILAHLAEITVSVGFEVKAGDKLGTSDSTGFSTAPHLHWGYYRIPRDRSNGWGGFVDQTPYMAASIPVAEPQPAAPPVAPGTKLYTQEQYDAAMNDRNKFWAERDQLQKDLDVKNTELVKVKEIVTEFQALGYNDVDDVKKIVKDKDDANLKLQTQVAQVLDRNKTLADMVSKKEEEDYTAIELGINAANELHGLKEDFDKVKKSVGINPEQTLIGVTSIIRKIEDFKNSATKAFQKGKSEAEAANKIEDNKVAQASAGGFSFLLNLLGLNKEVKDNAK